ncbi:MAG TPA: GNAT family N-acetyltransferase [Pararhizobium sp.]|nr:GNAT family N-acetyltransferase [Pararhizobium sp.]
MQVDVLSDGDGIEEEWWDLWRRDRDATPFQSPAWLLPWRRHFSQGRNVVLTLKENGRLMALLPLFEHEGRLLPWGAGTSDWLDGIFGPALEPAALARGVAQLPLPVDFFQLRSGSPLMRMPLPEGWSESTGAAECCAVLALPMRLGRKMAQNLGYYRRRADRAGVGEAQRGEPCDFDALADLHGRRWRERGENGVLSDPRVLAHLREALPALDAAGLLRLYILGIGAETAAALLVFTAKRRSFYYIGGFDPQHAALGLGTILINHAIGEAEREGHRSFDFLRGREPYKYRWGAEDEPTYARRLVPPRRMAGS